MTWKTATYNFQTTLEALEADNVGQLFPADDAFAFWRNLAVTVRENDRTVYLIGNGASASMASHFAADLAKNGGVYTRVFTDLSEITAIGNDIGFDQIYSAPLSRFSRKGDILVAISSSGRSPNILNAVEVAKRRGVTVVTLSGFMPDNPLRAKGDLNFYVPAHTYGMVETCHASILHYWMDSMMLPSDSSQ